MDKPKTKLADLDQPLEELSSEQATDVRGGLFTTGLADTTLGTSTTTTSDSTTSNTSTKPSVSEFTIKKTTDQASP